MLVRARPDRPRAGAAWAGLVLSAALPILSLAPARAEAERERWSLFGPCRSDCAVAVYGGSAVEDGMEDVLLLEPRFPTDWTYRAGDDFVGLAVSRRAGTLWGRIDIEPEIGVGRRLDQSVTEVWAAAFARYRGFPWDRTLVTTVALSTGLNYASSFSAEERERTAEEGPYRLMHYLAPEVTFALPSRPGLELMFRFHHRSGAYGLINSAGGGVHYGTVGLRLRF